MGIWEAGPTVIVYLPASRETRPDRFLFQMFCQGQPGASWITLVPNRASAGHLKVGPTAGRPQPPVYLPNQHSNTWMEITLEPTEYRD
jgi:hypothetical protein